MAAREPGPKESDVQKQFTVTVSSELGSYLEERAAETGMNKSAVVSEALKSDRQRRKELLIREGYEALAEKHLELVREFEYAGESVGWPSY